ncbi:Uncharacterised protein [Klebsiella oxytoca]|nr:Uncharacterised protein [Klebsiella oxytoca]
MSGFRQKMSTESISGTGQPGGLWRDIPGRRGLNGERAHGTTGQAPRQRRGATSETALPLTARRPFAGVRKAQATARKRAAHPDRDAAGLPLTSDIRHQPAGPKPPGGFGRAYRILSRLAECGSTTGRAAVGSRRCPRVWSVRKKRQKRAYSRRRYHLASQCQTGKRKPDI